LKALCPWRRAFIFINMEAYIVTLKEEAVSEMVRKDPSYENRQQQMKPEAEAFIDRLNIEGTIERVYAGTFFGFVIRCSDGAARDLRLAPDVKTVEKDRPVRLGPPVS